MNSSVLCGGITGFVYFLYKLESPGMGNILFRANSDGIKVFSLDSLLSMIAAPFQYIYFWTNSNLYSVNWVLTTFVGGLICYSIFI